MVYYRVTCFLYVTSVSISSGFVLKVGIVCLQLVLINISDHHTRLRANSQSNSAPTVMGCLLGAQSGRTVDVSNSFEIKYATTEQGVQIDEPFLAKKQEQCKHVAVLDMFSCYGWSRYSWCTRRNGCAV